MNKRNYQTELDRVLEEIRLMEARDKRPARLFLHSCCAPCSSYVLEYLSDFFEITDYFYNPNIEPAEEYRHREEELRGLIGRMRTRYPVRFLAGSYDPAEYYEAVRGLEHIREGGERCFACYRLRMEESARMAAEGGYDYFTTTLSISPLKNAAKINEIGEELEAVYGVRHLPSDFKKRGGYQRSIELSKEYGLYRQDYCGCVFSKQEREQQKERFQMTDPEPAAQE